MIRRLALLLVSALTAIAALTGCSHSAPVSYAPAAYGEVIGGHGRCYYDDDPYEAQQLLLDGSCPAGWIAYPMPLAWHESYWGFYSSPSYYNRYVIVSHRTIYVTHETTFHATYSTQINTASKTATYKGSNGKTVSGSKVDTAKMKFSTGSGSTGKVGGGSLRSGTTGGSTGGTGGGTGSGGSKTTTTVKPKTGGGSLGGGSLRVRK
jgi:hypothetical protein